MEIWKDIFGYEGKYQVSNMGNVKSLSYMYENSYKPRNWQNKPAYELIKTIRYTKEGLLSKSYLNGYYRVKLINNEGKTKSFLIHRLVYFTFNNLNITFLGQKSKTLVCHRNDIKNDNRLENLFLGTQKDNMQDMVNKGRYTKRKIKKKKIGFADVENIKKDYNNLKSIYKVAIIYRVSYATISRVINNKIWKN